MDKRDFSISNILAYGLVLILIANIFWLFNKNPLSDNTEIRNTTTPIHVSCSETKRSGPDGMGIDLYYTYSFKGDITDDSVQALIKTMDEISSRKRKLDSVGGVAIYGGADNSDISISYMIDDRYIDLVMTNEKDVMFDMGTEGAAYTLNEGDFEKLVEIIKQYNEN